MYPEGISLDVRNNISSVIHGIIHSFQFAIRHTITKTITHFCPPVQCLFRSIKLLFNQAVLQADFFLCPGEEFIHGDQALLLFTSTG